MVPPKPPDGPRNWNLWARGITRYIDENRPISGMGSLVSQQSGGRAVNVTFAASSPEAGISLHNIPGLAGHIPDPTKIAADVLTAVTGSITLPNPATLISNLSGAFSSVLNGGSIPTESTVQAWVDAYLGTTLNSLIGDIEATTNSILSTLYSGVPEALSAYFSAPNAPLPRNGDYIYTETAGIVYVIFRQVGGVPSGNSIFRAPFTVASGEDEQTWVALTTFPAPNISDLVSSIAALVMAGLNALMSLLSHLLVAAIMALFNFAAEILPLIEALIAAALAAVWAAIEALQEALEILTEHVHVLELLLENITTLDVIDTAGYARPITVLDADAGSDFKNTHKFIDPETGGTFELKFPTWFATVPGGDTDFKVFYWLGQDGTHWAAEVLMNTSAGYPKVEDTPTAAGTLYSRETVNTCDEGLIDILKAEHAD